MRAVYSRLRPGLAKSCWLSACGAAGGLLAAMAAPWLYASPRGYWAARGRRTTSSYRARCLAVCVRKLKD